MSIVRPATTLRTTVPGFTEVPSDTKTPSTCLGFTARTTMSASAVSSEAVRYMRIP
ncbi:MAG: hypothetical protein Q4Q62_02305 [Thermoplasmata archaeon]|nr:hypothetical protein [Thermoplasmata archaeon]